MNLWPVEHLKKEEKCIKIWGAILSSTLHKSEPEYYWPIHPSQSYCIHTWLYSLYNRSITKVKEAGSRCAVGHNHKNDLKREEKCIKFTSLPLRKALLAHRGPLHVKKNHFPQKIYKLSKTKSFLREVFLFWHVGDLSWEVLWVNVKKNIIVNFIIQKLKSDHTSIKKIQT